MNHSKELMRACALLCHEIPNQCSKFLNFAYCIHDANIAKWMKM